MTLNQWNQAKLIHIKPYKRNSKEFDALIFFYKISGTKHKVKRTINIPEENNSSSFLIKWIKKKNVKAHSLDLKNPHELAKAIFNKTRKMDYELYLELSPNKMHINIEDCRPYIKSVSKVID